MPNAEASASDRVTGSRPNPAAVASHPTPRPVAMLHAVTILLGAFLLFMVQPILARYILPWFGGSPGVWTTAMLVFQALLLAGYAYAHFAVKLSVRAFSMAHLAVIAAAAVSLPILVSDGWKPVDGSDPTLRIAGLLLATAGIPYLLLSTTSPLVQTWASAAAGGRSPYRLYALSNAGSLIALLGYPLLVEPLLGRRGQSLAWSALFGVYLMLLTACLWVRWRRTGVGTVAIDAAAGIDSHRVEATKGSDVAGVSPATSPQPTRTGLLLWVTLSACGSVLLLAVTNRISQEVAVVPLLWILPLAVYLLSFVVAFDSPRWYARAFWMPLLAATLAGACWLLIAGQDLPIVVQVGVLVTMLLSACMVCHGELARLKPHPSRLTAYFLAVSVGGVLGGLLVAVVAPLVFRGYHELHASMAAAAVLAATTLWRDPKSPLYRGTNRIAWYAIGAFLIGLTAVLAEHTRSGLANATRVEQVRTFHGVLSVYDDRSDPDHPVRMMQHGAIAHGLQFLNPAERGTPTAYYVTTSGIGRLMQSLADRGPLNVGVIGLGTGTLGAYSRPGDQYTFYEINPEVEVLARRHFTFLKDTPADVRVVLGDARLTLERQPPQAFDVLAIDAFSGDAVPVHLLTAEAMDGYRRHVSPSGVIAFHISNQHLNLEPIIQRLADRAGWNAVVVDDVPDDATPAAYLSRWVLLSDDPTRLSADPIAPAARAAIDAKDSEPLWTDDRSSLLPILRRKRL